MLQEKDDGTSYSSKHRFSCQAQADGFKSLLEGMASRPQDYVSARGRLTTNAVEGFHGLALMYRDKRTDLGHTHYVCKTNMAICHKVNKLEALQVCTYYVYENSESWTIVEGSVSASDGSGHPRRRSFCHPPEPA